MTPHPWPRRRALAIRSSAVPEVALLEPLQLEGEEGVNRLFEYRLTLSSRDPDIDLGSLVGRELTCGLELDGPDVAEREISGLITQARYVGEAERHSRIELTLRPWLHLATLTTDCKVFQDQSPVEIIEAVLGEYPFAADKRLIEHYPRRDYTVQYNETDFEFLSRLMQEWGINYHFEHSAGVHRLIWSDHNAAFQASASSRYHDIPYYPLGHKIDREYIHGFSPVQRLTSGRYASRDYDYTRPRAPLAVEASAPREGSGHAHQEVYVWRGDRAGMAGSDHSQPNAGADKQANGTEAQGEHLARLRMQGLRQGGQRARGVGHVRGIVPGCSFHLSNHPHSSANTEYLTLHTRLLVENIGEDSQRVASVPMSGSLSGPSSGPLTGQWRVHVEFDVQPSTEALRPEATQRKPRTGGPESALVVGPSDANLHTDALGRIKIQFPWDRYGQKNQNSSCWVRVSSAWAGNQLGAMHLPRVGQEVLVSFLGGDPDQPVVSGRLYNQANQPPWSLPEQQALSGFRSRELSAGGGNGAGGRSNHLILDDTEQRIQAQLKSDHQHSQLGLGHLSRIESHEGRRDERGQGFELRTDGHGVIRAKDGLLISTQGRPAAQSHAKDMGETTSRLGQAQQQHEDLGELAQQHRAQEAQDQAEVAARLQAQNEAIAGQHTEGPFPELSEPHLVLASPAGIESTTAGSTHQHSGQHHAITAGAHASVSAGKSWLVSAREAIKLFAYRAGMKLVAAKGDIDIQALQRNIQLLAKLDITQTANRITLTAQEEVVFNGGGSATTWASGRIHSATLGTWANHAGAHAMLKAVNAPLPMVDFPAAREAQPPQQQLRVLLQHLPGDTPHTWVSQPYALYKNDALVTHGVTDATGHITIDEVDPDANYTVEVGQGLRFAVPVVEQFAPPHDTSTHREQRLSSQGVRADGTGTASRQAQATRDQRA